MPKEMIGSRDKTYVVRVGWTPEQDVQVGVELGGEGTLVRQLYGDEHSLTRLGYLVREWFREPHDAELDAGRSAGEAVLQALEAVSSYRVVWAILNRGQCNYLVRVVRRARDSAFGGDE